MNRLFRWALLPVAMAGSLFAIAMLYWLIHSALRQLCPEGSRELEGTTDLSNPPDFGYVTLTCVSDWYPVAMFMLQASTFLVAVAVPGLVAYRMTFRRRARE